MKKRKVKRYDEGGILRDRYGNPVRSGSGEPVRTTYPDSASRYNEQATADMVESSDYSGRRRKSEPLTSELMPKSKVSAKDIGFTGSDEDIKPSKKAEAPSADSDYSEDDRTSGMLKALRIQENKTKQTEAAERRAREKRKAALEKSTTEKSSGSKYEGVVKGSDLGSQSFSAIPKAAETKKRGMFEFGPKITYNTPEKLEKARKSYYSGFKSGGSVSSASKRADGIATKGKTRGRIC